MQHFVTKMLMGISNSLAHKDLRTVFATGLSHYSQDCYQDSLTVSVTGFLNKWWRCMTNVLAALARAPFFCHEWYVGQELGPPTIQRPILVEGEVAHRITSIIWYML